MAAIQSTSDSMSKGKSDKKDADRKDHCKSKVNLDKVPGLPGIRNRLQGYLRFSQGGNSQATAAGSVQSRSDSVFGETTPVVAAGKQGAVLPLSSSYEKDLPALLGTTNGDMYTESTMSAWVKDVLDHGLHLVSTSKVDN